MNKVILSLLLAVCILGMALIMLNERLGRKFEPAPTPSAEISQPAAPNNGADRPPLPEDGNRNGFAAPPEGPLRTQTAAFAPGRRRNFHARRGSGFGAGSNTSGFACRSRAADRRA